MTYRPRLFAGIELTANARAACAGVTNRLKSAGLPGRFEPAEKLHLTLAFLGNVTAEIVAPVQEALANACAQSPAFVLTIDRVGAFPHERRPRVVYAGCREPGTPFHALSTRVRAALGELGFRFESAAVAHVTLARIKGGDAHLPSVEFSPIDLGVDAVALFESIPDGRTTRYDVIRRIKLL